MLFFFYFCDVGRVNYNAGNTTGFFNVVNSVLKLDAQWPLWDSNPELWQAHHPYPLDTKTDTTYFIFRMNGFPFSDMTIIVIAGATLLFSIVFLVISTYTSQSLSSYHLPSSQLNKCAYCFTTAVSIIIVVFNKYSKTFGVVFFMHRKDNSYIKNQVIDRCHKSWYIF